MGSRHCTAIRILIKSWGGMLILFIDTSIKKINIIAANIPSGYPRVRARIHTSINSQNEL